MKQCLKRWTALLLALVMTASLLPGVTLPAAAQTATVGTLDHTDVISLPITIRNYAADGMLFEWDGIGGGVYEEKPFRNPYNTSGITEPVPYVGVNLALGQLFCNDWDVSNLNKNGIQYHYGETYDSRYAHIAPANSGWHEYTVWNSNVDHGNDTNYMVIRFRSTGDPFQDTLYVKRYKNGNEYWQSGVDLTVSSAYGAYKLVGTEDGWTTIAVDLNDSGVNPLFHNANGQESNGYPSEENKISKISIGFNNNNNDYQLDVSFVAFFIRLEDNQTGEGYKDPFRYCGYDFINQDYCFRMDDPTITMVEPRPAIGTNVLLSRTTTAFSVSGAGSDLDRHDQGFTGPEYDYDKYVTISAGTGEAATASLWRSDSGEYPAGMARYLAIRCKAVDANLSILANGSSIYSFNPATTEKGGDVLEVHEDSTTENGARVSWKTFVIDTHYSGSISEMGIQIPAGKSLDLAYAGLFEDYDLTLTTGYNYATDAHVFVFEDYSYRHDRVAYTTSVERYKIYTDSSIYPDENDDRSAIRIQRENSSALDPTVVYNNENNFYFKSSGSGAPTALTPVTSFNESTGTKNGTVRQVGTWGEDAYCYLELQDNDSEKGIGLRSILMTGVDKPAKDLQYVVVSYCVANPDSVPGDTTPMYVLLDTKSSGFSDPADVVLGFFDAVADGKWHVDVLDLSNCVSRSPNGETFRYKTDAFTANANISRIGLADGWAVQGTKLQLAYMAFFKTRRDAEQYGNAYSEAFKSVQNPPEGADNAYPFSVLTDAFTAKTGYQLNEGFSGSGGQWEDKYGNKKFRVGSNNGFELIDPDYAYNNSNYSSGLPNYYEDKGFGEWVKNNSSYTNYNLGPNGEIGYYNDPQYSNNTLTDNRTRDLETNGKSDIYASSDDSYGYIMGLTKRELVQVGDEKQLRYRQEVVEYLAQLLRKALCVPRTFMENGVHYFSANFVQGDVDGSRFGYYDEAEPGQPENVNAMFPRDFAGWLRFQLGVTERDGSLVANYDPNLTFNGSYADTDSKSDDLLSDDPQLGMNSIRTWTDAAYYMLNTLFLETGGSHTVPEYKYLQLVREQPKDGGASYYVFDTSYTNILFDFDRGIIGNNSKNVSPDTAIKDTTNGVVATYAFLPILRELPEFQGTFPYLKDTGIAAKDDGADSYYNRDYNFSLECHGTFTYYRDKDLFFEFDGDDDVYLYVNNKCVLDIGGGHRPANQLIKLNDYVDHNILQLVDGENYDFDFYYLERHGTGSNLRIETNMEVYGDKIVTTKAAEQSGRELEDYSDADFSQPVSYSYSITHTGDLAEVMTDFAFNDDSIGFYAGFDKVELGKDRQATDLGVRVTDRSGALVSDTPVQDVDHLRRLLTDLDEHGGLQYGQTLTLYGVKYTIGSSFAAFSNTVISRAGKHSGVAYHHLINAGSTCHFYAWKGHELDIPFAKILQAIDPADTSDWTDFYLCDEDLVQINDPTAQSDLHISQWEIVKTGNDNFEKHIKVTFTETGTHEILITQEPSEFPEGIQPYAIKAEVRVLDVVNDVYVLDFDGTVHLGKGNTDKNSFVSNDILSVPGVKTKVRYEAFTDVAPNYADGRVSFPYGAGQNELWPKAKAAATYKLTVNLSDNTQSSGGRLVQTDLTAGTAVTQVVVSPADPVQYVFPNGPDVTENSQVKANFVPADDILFIKMNAGEDYWLIDNAIHFIYFFMDNTHPNPIWKRPYPISSDGSVYAVQIPRINGILYKNLVIVRKDPGGAQGNEPNWEDEWNQSGDISIVGFGPQKNYISTFKDKKNGGSYTFNSAYSEPAANKFGYYRISGTMTDHDVTISFPAAVSPTTITGTNSMDPILGTRTLPRAGDEPQPVPAPFYFQKNGQMENGQIPDAGAEFSSDQGSFLVRLPAKNSEALPQLDFKPEIMDGTAVIWLTSRVYEGTNPGEFLGNVDSTKEVEMFQSVTVLPANVVYYEDTNPDVNINPSLSYEVTWTSGTNAPPDQSAEQNGAYGYDNGYASGQGHEYGGNSSTKITFRGDVTLADFDFTGTGFDLFSRCVKDGPTVNIRVYDYVAPNGSTPHDYSSDAAVKTVLVGTEFTNQGGPEDEAMYQVPIVSVQNLRIDTVNNKPLKYHVVIEGLARLDMAHWEILAQDGKYYLHNKVTDETWEMIIPTPGSGQPVMYQQNGDESTRTSTHPAAMELSFWLDGLRVYGALSAEDQTNYYNADEANASFIEVHDLMLQGRGTAINYTDTNSNFTIDDGFVTTVELRNPAEEGSTLAEIGTARLDDYFTVGPNNELYLNGVTKADGTTTHQAAVFSVKAPAGSTAEDMESFTFQIAAKLLDSTSLGGSFGGYADLAWLTVGETWVPLGPEKLVEDPVSGQTGEPQYGIQSATELYYKIDPRRCPKKDDSYLVIIATGTNSVQNPSNALVSLTKIKYKGWEFDTAFTAHENFETNEAGEIVGVTEAGNSRLSRIIRLLTASTYFKPGIPFRDVAANAWYYDAVTWAFENGITSGTSADRFSPNLGCTRAQVVSFLWNAAGRPAAAQHAAFTDVSPNAWYAEAVDWAVEHGITAGSSETTFSPGKTCTRAQAVTFLWRSVGSPQAAQPADFQDVSADAWYAEAVAWAVENGVTAGTGASSFSPMRTCTRAQVVTFLFRQAESMNGGVQQ